MIGLLASPAGRALGTLAIGAAIVAGAYLYGRHEGRQAVLDSLAAARITILRDGKEIDEKVLAADDDVLCALLGGCL